MLKSHYFNNKAKDSQTGSERFIKHKRKRRKTFHNFYGQIHKQNLNNKSFDQIRNCGQKNTQFQQYQKKQNQPLIQRCNAFKVYQNDKQKEQSLQQLNHQLKMSQRNLQQAVMEITEKYNDQLVVNNQMVNQNKYLNRQLTYQEKLKAEYHEISESYRQLGNEKQIIENKYTALIEENKELKGQAYMYQQQMEQIVKENKDISSLLKQIQEIDQDQSKELAAQSDKRYKKMQKINKKLFRDNKKLALLTKDYEKSFLEQKEQIRLLENQKEQLQESVNKLEKHKSQIVNVLKNFKLKLKDVCNENIKLTQSNKKLEFQVASLERIQKQNCIRKGKENIFRHALQARTENYDKSEKQQKSLNQELKQLKNLILGKDKQIKYYRSQLTRYKKIKSITPLKENCYSNIKRQISSSGMKRKIEFLLQDTDISDYSSKENMVYQKTPMKSQINVQNY